MTTPSPEPSAALVIAAHGSTDPGFALVVADIAARVRAFRPSLRVRVGFLDHGPPHLADAVDDGCVVVPLFLASGYHVLVDLPAQAPSARLATALGPDPRLAEALADRLAQAGYDGSSPVVLAAAGSSDDSARADVHRAAQLLAERLGADVTAAFLGTGEPALAQLQPRVVSPYLIAPGVFFDSLRRLDLDVLGAPLGDHPAIAETVVARYDQLVRG